MFEQVKAHVGRHKVAYSVGVVVAIAGIAYYLGARSGSPTFMNKSASMVGGFNNKLNLSVIELVERQGPPSWITKCVETGEETSSQRIMTELHGISQSELSAHLNGLLPDVNGKHYVRLGLAA